MPIANQSTQTGTTTNPPRRVVMLLANPFTHDTRVHKQARTLIEWGLEVHIVCIAKPDLPNEEIVNGIHVHRVPVKDESVVRIVQGIAKLRSRELLGAWLERSFDAPLQPIVVDPEPRGPKPTLSTDLGSASDRRFDVGLEEAGADPVCPLPPIPPARVPPVPTMETTAMRLLAFPASWSQRSAARIVSLERMLLSEDSGSVFSKGSGSVLRTPARLFAHAALRCLRLIHRGVIHPVSVGARKRLSRETTRAARQHAMLVREHTIATIHAEREAARLTKIRDAQYVKQVRETERRPTETAQRIRARARQYAHEHTRTIAQRHKEAAIAYARQRKQHAAWKRRLRFLIKHVPSAVRIIGFNDELARTALRLQPDLVLSHDCNTLLAGRMLKEVLGCPLVYDSHELFLERNIGSRRRWVDKLCWWPIEKICIGHCDACFTVAEGIARHLEGQFGIPEVHLLRNVQPYEPPPTPLPDGVPSPMHRELGLDPSVRVVIYPGAITINRGLEFMIDAAPMLDNAVFVVMGYATSEPYMNEILDRARTNGTLDTRIFFKDAVPIDEVGQWVAGASLGVVPTQGVCMSYRFEASNKMFHCLMAGVPLAMSDHPEKRLLAERFGVGTLFDETSAESISRAVNATLNDAENLLRMKRNCLEAAKVLNWEHEVHRYLTIMSELLPEHPTPVPPIHIPALGSATGRMGALEHGPLITVANISNANIER